MFKQDLENYQLFLKSSNNRLFMILSMIIILLFSCVFLLLKNRIGIFLSLFAIISTIYLIYIDEIEENKNKIFNLFKNNNIENLIIKKYIFSVITGINIYKLDNKIKLSKNYICLAYKKYDLNNVNIKQYLLKNINNRYLLINKLNEYGIDVEQFYKDCKVI